MNKIISFGAVVMQVVYKDVAKPKLTIAKDRVELKLPSEDAIKDERRIIDFAQKIADELGEVDQTLRGNFSLNPVGKWYVAMYKGTKTNNVPRTHVKSFEE
jgi:hypothetical protein